tara:strand:- start:1089 stop:1319 length:231 start_codon:yes stop_codon:yes gene_type:complete
MVFNCALCKDSDEYILTGYFCSECSKIKNLISVYGKDIHKSLDNVYKKTDKGIKSKVLDEIQKKKSDLEEQINDVK